MLIAIKIFDRTIKNVITLRIFLLTSRLKRETAEFTELSAYQRCQKLIEVALTVLDVVSIGGKLHT